MQKIKDQLKSFFPIIKNRARLILVLLLLLVIGIYYSRFFTVVLFIAIFIAAAGISKIYHRMVHTTIGVDLVFFTTVMTALVYRNLFLSLFVGWAGLIIADSIGTRFSYTSIISLISLTLVSLLSTFFFSFPIVISAILLMAIFEIVSALLYGLMGSSPDKIILFVVSHFLFNLFLIISFARPLSELMV